MPYIAVKIRDVIIDCRRGIRSLRAAALVVEDHAVFGHALHLQEKLIVGFVRVPPAHAHPQRRGKARNITAFTPFEKQIGFLDRLELFQFLRHTHLDTSADPAFAGMVLIFEIFPAPPRHAYRHIPAERSLSRARRTGAADRMLVFHVARTLTVIDELKIFCFDPLFEKRYDGKHDQQDPAEL